MTAEEVVSVLLEDDGADFLWESLRWVVEQLMAEVSMNEGRGQAAVRASRRSPSSSGNTALCWRVYQTVDREHSERTGPGRRPAAPTGRPKRPRVG